ncbi:MAG: rhomboid family intramembrane serine protease [Gemmatimonadota bacterium]|nr:rhomboid family intramembrane serine protease [Gemmatimonadota bacterium]
MTPWVLRLLFANFAAYLLVPRMSPLYMDLLLVPAEVLARPWTPITYMFLHGHFWHILFNMLVLFFFGPRLEATIGSRKFLGLYFISGLTAALFSAITPYVAVVGASGAIYGLILAYAGFWPRDRIYIWGILPVEARWMVIFLTAWALVGTIPLVAAMLGIPGLHVPTDNVAHHAHLGGFAGAWLFMRWRAKHTGAAKFRRQAEPETKKGWLRDREAIQRWTKIDREALHPVNRETYDEIMQKLSLGGAGTLSDRERSFLERLSTSD